VLAVRGEPGVSILRREVQGTSINLIVGRRCHLLRVGQGFVADLAVCRDFGFRGDGGVRGNGNRRRERQVRT
jgi:hypothetical protein